MSCVDPCVLWWATQRVTKGEAEPRSCSCADPCVLWWATQSGQGRIQVHHSQGRTEHSEGSKVCVVCSPESLLDDAEARATVGTTKDRRQAFEMVWFLGYEVGLAGLQAPRAPSESLGVLSWPTRVFRLLAELRADSRGTDMGKRLETRHQRTLDLEWETVVRSRRA